MNVDLPFIRKEYDQLIVEFYFAKNVFRRGQIYQICENLRRESHINTIFIFSNCEQDSWNGGKS